MCFNMKIINPLLQDCGRPLGLESGSVKDEQITAINTRGIGVYVYTDANIFTELSEMYLCGNLCSYSCLTP